MKPLETHPNPVHALQLSRLVGTDALQEFQNTFAQTAGVAAGLMDAGGEWFGAASNQTRFCQLVRSKKKGREACRACDEKALTRAYRTGQTTVYRCHAGLIDFAAPVSAAGAFVGGLLGGQALPAKASKKDVARFREVARRIGISPRRLIQAANDVHFVARARIKKAADEAARTAALIAERAVTVHSLKAIQEMAAALLSKEAAVSMDLSRLQHDRVEQELAREIDRLWAANSNVAQMRKCVCDTVVTAARRLPNVDRASLRMADHAAGKLYFVAWQGAKWDAAKTSVAYLIGEAGIAGRVADTQEPKLVADVRQVSGFVKLIASTRSHASVPIVSRGLTVGVLSIDSDQIGKFNDSHLNALQSLATVVATALDHVRLYIEDRLQQILHLIGGALLFQDDLDRLAGSIASIVGADACSLFLKNRSTRRFELTATTGIEARRARGSAVWYRPGEGLTGWVLKHRRPLRLVNVHDKEERRRKAADLTFRDKHPERLLAPQQKNLQYMAVPILVGSTLVGVIRAASNAVNTAFTHYDERILTRIAEAIAAGHSKIRQASAVDSRQSALYDCAKAIIAGRGLPEILDSIVHHAVRALDAKYGFVQLFEKEGTGYRMADCVANCEAPQTATKRLGVCPMSDTAPGGLHRWRPPASFLEKSITLKVARTRVPHKTGDVLHDDFYLEFYPDTRSELAVPLLLGNDLIGVVNVESPHFNAFTQAHEDLLCAMGSYASAAVDRARSASRRERAELMARAKGWEHACRMLDHRLSERLEATRRELNAAEVALRGNRSARAIIQVTAANRNVEHVIAALSSQGTSAEAKEIFPEQTLPITQLLANARSTIADIFPKLTLHLDSGLPKVKVRASQVRFAEVIEVLCSNSITHSGLGIGSLEMSLSACIVPVPPIPPSAKPRRVCRIKVSDNGVGISRERKVRIFDSSRGLGLKIAKHHVDHLGGTIKEVGKPGHGVLFLIDFPLNDGKRGT